MNNIAGVILAGGKNTRYKGFDKSFLKKGNITFVEHIFTVLKKVFDEVIVITNQAEEYHFIEAKKYQDLVTDIGPLGGIYTALKTVEQSAIFVVSCDMPYLDHFVIKQLTKAYDKSNSDILIPRINGCVEPLNAIYSTGIIPHIEKNIKNNKFAIRDLFPLVNMRYLDLPSTPENIKHFTNINSPEEFENFIFKSV